ncbi:terminase small subunit [Lactiplantibacillus plantarum]|uniref:terminase small subunit n=1 Tax=Lactiplantibacillus plantarum TaxID=1590 RepID=UPI001E65B8A0|nr:terminase small subunit [Lactiplantibacillus plantarum]MCC6117085.1 terminase small subunit [Lactiplantibacillus plantarum]MCW6114633.1 terminase small subunit [Lactiplantibacillus plantarum]
MKRKLTPKQRKFANEFIKTNNAYQSAINAGYSKNYASVGTKKLLENVRIQNYIQQKTGDVEKRESVEADEVLKNIYRISAGKEIERHYVKIDNLAKEAVGGDDSIEARMEYTTDETTITPASTKEQVAAAELWFKLSGRLKNDSKDVEDQKIRKLKADADIAEAKAKEARSGDSNEGQTLIVDDVGGIEDEDAGS